MLANAAARTEAMGIERVDADPSRKALERSGEVHPAEEQEEEERGGTIANSSRKYVGTYE